MKKKFDIAYLVAREKLAFRKMGALCDLEQRHGVDLGEGYRTIKLVHLSLTVSRLNNYSTCFVHWQTQNFSVFKLMVARILPMVF